MWVSDTEADGLLCEVTKMHCLVTKKYKKDLMYVFCKTEELSEGFIEATKIKYPYVEFKGLEDVTPFLNKCDAIVMHNIFGYDLPMLQQLGYIDTYDMYPENINGNNCRLIDTLSMSRTLHPDRLLPRGCPSKVYNTVTKKYNTVGGHGLHSWGMRVANLKPKVDDWRNQHLDVYVNRCLEDVAINELVLQSVIKESEQNAVDGGDWKVPLRINNKCDFLMEKQETDGILFDQEAAWKLLDRVDNWMDDIEANVNPQLPRREMPLSRRPTFPKESFKGDGAISGNGWNWLEKHLGYSVNRYALEFVAPPKTALKKDNTLSKAGENYCIKNGITEPEKMMDFISDQNAKALTLKVLPDETLEKAKEDLRNKVMPDITEPMTISNQQDIKKYLYRDEGWRPELWRVKDVSRDAQKQAHPEHIVREKVKEYILDTKNSIYKNCIYREMDMDFDTTPLETLIKNLVRKARFLVTSPKFKDERGDLCPHLSTLKGDMAKEIVTWLSLRNRRSVLKAQDEDKETGWLNNPRLAIDGRIGQGHSGPTNTNRYKHRTIVNLPKVDPSVLLGYEMRSLFIAPKGKKILGYDGSNLEQFVAASYAYEYDNGAYAELIAGDAHSTNAKAYTIAAGREVGRGEGKGITYATLYGAGAAKIAKMLGVSKEKGQAVIDAFWDTNFGLKAVKEYLENYWEKKSGKRYIKGIDGRKIYTRSKSSLVNALFQSCGSIIMFLSGLFMYDALKREGLIDKGVVRLAFVHDEYQYEVPDELIETYTFDTEEEAKEFSIGGKLLSNVGHVGDKFVRYYSRVGVLGDWSLTQAGKYFKLPLPFNAAYDIGDNLAETH